MGTARQQNNKPSPRQADWILLGHIEDTQIAIMLAILIGTKVFLMFPSMITQMTGSSSWIATIIALLAAFLGLHGWILWIKTTGGLGIAESIRLTLGRFLGDILLVFLIIYYTLTTAFSIRMFGGGSVIGLLPEFPIEIVIATIIAAGIYPAWLGLEPCARAAVFFSFPIAATFVLVILGSWRSFDMRHIYPIWGFGPGTTLKEGLFHTGIFGSISALGVWKSYVREPDKLKRSGRAGLLLAGLAMIVSTFYVVAVFPYPECVRQVMPVGVISRAVYLGRFLQRLEAIFTFSWFFASAVHASVSYMLTLILLSQLMNIKTYRPLVPSLMSLTFGIGAIPGPLLWVSRLLGSVYLTMGNFEIALGWILYAIAHFRHVREKADQLSKNILVAKDAPWYSEDEVLQPQEDHETQKNRSKGTAGQSEKPSGKKGDTDGNQDTQR